ncbi:MAG: protein-(glutamine-N5) methyltransferase, release factor-specific [Deltaproteobacteria bacterium RBG_16_50_11]|nr:MAG: protein-(glutamine-N5) methyltransferase, release factor-specific [Deltaproteobacteria bacterium RBG_16_50_11]
MTVLEILNRTTKYLKDRQVESPRLNAELLLAHSLNFTREGLYTHLQDSFKEEEKKKFERLVERRISGEPLQYLLGHQEFWSIDLKVDPRVLIPRPETELLVEQSLLLLKEPCVQDGLSVLEIGTGSGAISVALAKEREDLLIVATDVSREALLLARENALLADVVSRIQFIQGDLFAPFRLSKKKEPFDLILSNPPYVNRSDIRGLAREVKDFEPILALDGGEDGFAFYRKILPQAASYLRKGGWLLLEAGQGQGEKVSEMIMSEGHFQRPELVQDFSGIERVVKAQRK